MSNAQVEIGGGPPQVGIREVAERAGVAVSSVSRVLTGHPDVSRKMRERVERAMQECDYEPNVLAQSLRRGATKTIGFIVSDVSNPLMAHIALGAETTLHEAGYSTLMSNSGNVADRDAEHLRLFRQRRVDGLLLSIADESHDPTLSELRRLPKPAVFMDRDVEGVPNASNVVFDHRSGVAAAGEHLLNLGHRHIGLIAGSSAVRPTRERISALTATCTAVGARLSTIAGSSTREHGLSAAAALLDRPDRPTAIFCGSNQILPGLLIVARARGLRIPEDLSIVTTDRLDLAEFYSPPIAAIVRDSTLMGEAAARQLLDRISGAVVDTLVLPTIFDPGASCAAPAR